MRSKFWRRLTRATLHHADKVDGLLARGMFEQRFGTGFVPAYSFTVGRPIFVGGGLWLK